MEEEKKEISARAQDQQPALKIAVPLAIAPTTPLLLRERRRYASNAMLLLKIKPSGQRCTLLPVVLFIRRLRDDIPSIYRYLMRRYGVMCYRKILLPVLL